MYNNSPVYTNLIGSMGLVYLPALINSLFLWYQLVGKYTFRPMDPMGLEVMIPKKSWKTISIPRKSGPIFTPKGRIGNPCDPWTSREAF